MDAVTLALARKYTSDTAIGLGAVKGAPCTIKSTEEVEGGTKVTFEWTGDDGTKRTSFVIINNGINGERGEDGVSVVDIEINDDKELICTLDNGTRINAGQFPETGEEISLAEYNALSQEEKESRTWYVYDDDEGQSGVLENSLSANVAIGSVTVGKVYSAGTSLEEIIRDMLTEKIPPAVSIAISPSTTLYDVVNDSVNSLTINVSVTKKTNNIAFIKYYINDTLVKENTSGVANGGSFPYIYNTTIDETTIIKVVVEDSEGLTTTATKTIEFVGVSYYGIVDAEIGVPTESIIKTLNKKLKNTKRFVYEGITTDWGKVCYAYPSSMSALASIKDEVNSFNYTTSFAKNAVTVDGIEYFVYTQIDASSASNVEITFA